MAGLGPKTLCCGKPYTKCECTIAELSDEVFELPPIPEKPISITENIPPALYPGTPAAWRPIMNWGGFQVMQRRYP